VQLQRIKHELRRSHGDAFDEKVAITASTGAAAVSIGGTTVHSLLGCAIPKTVKDFDKMWDEKSRERLRKLETLVIDEISMVAGELLDRVDMLLRKMRNSTAVFGGIQLVVCGDFFQLAPISDKPPHWNLPTVADFESLPSKDKKKQVIPFRSRGYAFQSHCWREANFYTVRLLKVHRQADEAFVAALGAVRTADLKRGDQHDQLLRSCERKLGKTANDILPTKLYATNKTVDKDNAKQLALLPRGQFCHVFNCIDDVEIDDMVPDCHRKNVELALKQSAFFKECRAASTLELKAGAQVCAVLRCVLAIREPGNTKQSFDRCAVSLYRSCSCRICLRDEVRTTRSKRDW